MAKEEILVNVLAYIEENLENELNISILARVSGYSEYHFLRFFHAAMGLTPADYIRKRRISEVARCMMDENRPISDLAFSYGFNSKENFIRAFKREHQILPGQYKSARNSLKLYAPQKPEPVRLFQSLNFEYWKDFGSLRWKARRLNHRIFGINIMPKGGRENCPVGRWSRILASVSGIELCAGCVTILAFGNRMRMEILPIQ